MSLPKSQFDGRQDDPAMQGAERTASPQAELANEHALVTALRDIIQNPQRHTVGGLSEVILQSLAELSLLKDRIDLLTQKDTAADAGVTPGSGAPAGAENPFVETKA